MPQDRIGVLLVVIGEHCSALPDALTEHVYERLLGLNFTPWTDRWLDVGIKNKKAGTEARAKSGADRVPDTKPSHPLKDYAAITCTRPTAPSISHSPTISSNSTFTKCGSR
jgi:hypothetical protein